MLRIRTLLLALVASVLVLGSAIAAGIVFDTSGFDPFDEDEGYVDIFLDGDTITFALQVEEGHLPAKLVGETLPLDGDFDEALLTGPAAMALYGGLPVATTVNTVMLDLDGDAQTIRYAVLARLSELGMTMSECFEGGPICTFEVSHGEDHWLLSITPKGDHAVVYMQTMR